MLRLRLTGKCQRAQLHGQVQRGFHRQLRILDIRSPPTRARTSPALQPSARSAQSLRRTQNLVPARRLDLANAARRNAQLIHAQAYQHCKASGSAASSPHTPTQLAMGMGRAHGDIDELQYRRVQAFSLATASGGHGQGARCTASVVGADAEEVHFLGQHRRQQRSGRHFDHVPSCRSATGILAQTLGHVPPDATLQPCRPWGN